MACVDSHGWGLFDTVQGASRDPEHQDTESQRREVEKETTRDYVVVFGDSNVKGAQIEMNDLDLDTVKLCRSGALLQDMNDLISEINVQPEQVKVVASGVQMSVKSTKIHCLK